MNLGMKVSMLTLFEAIKVLCRSNSNKRLLTTMLGDIEECASSAAPSLAATRARKGKVVLPRALRQRRIRKSEEEEKAEETTRLDCDSFIPGTQSVYVRTWGCSHNASDGEYMSGMLAAAGYSITDSPLSADLWLLNSCTVKGPSEDGLKNSIRKGRELGKPLVISGCVPQGQKNHMDIMGLSVVGVQQIDRVVEVVEETLKGNTVRLYGQRRSNGRKVGGAPLSLPKIRRNPLVEIIAINTGCLNQCTYCKTKHARGDLGSYQPDEIVERAKQAFEEGVVEVWLTSEDLGAYGRDIGVTLPQLLWQLLPVIPEGCMMRLGMTNPPYIMDHIEEMAAILCHRRVYAFLHIPVQCGSDSVLAEMRREYTVCDFTKLVDYLLEHVPGISIATDIICGFPTETEEDFKGTLCLVEHYQFPSLFINQFYPRPGTPAARMRRIPTHIVKGRSRSLSNLFQSYRPYSSLLGSSCSALFTELSRDGQHLVGHDKQYRQVLIPREEGLMGRMATVQITRTGKHFLMGEVVGHPQVSLPRPPPLPPGAVSGKPHPLNSKPFPGSRSKSKLFSLSLLPTSSLGLLECVVLVCVVMCAVCWVMVRGGVGELYNTAT